MNKVFRNLFFTGGLFLNMLLVSCKENVSFVPNNRVNEFDTFKADIKGAVMFPGIYDIDENMLLIDLINLAGGLKADADIGSINLASKIEPNEMIVIPTKEKNQNLININSATKEELMTLPGIGEAKAQNIINYRMKNGKFISIEELKKVSGISEEIYSKIKELVRI